MLVDARSPHVGFLEPLVLLFDLDRTLESYLEYVGCSPQCANGKQDSHGTRTISYESD